MGVAEREGPTPIVDEAFPDPIGVSPELPSALRIAERRARALYQGCEAALNEGDRCALLASVRAELRRFLFDGASSPLQRLVRRPPNQLVPELPARKSFQRVTDGIFERAERALALHPGMLEAQNELAALRGRYESRLPGLTKRHLEGARATEERLARVRTVADLAALRDRLARVSEILDSHLAEVPSDGIAAARVLAETATAGEMTLPELRAALSLATKERRGLEQVGSVRSTLDALAARHVNLLEGASVEGVRVPTNAHAVLEQMARRAAATQAGPSSEASHAAFWVGAFATAHNSAFPRPGRFAWYALTGTIEALESIPTQSTAIEAPVGERDAVFFVLPLLGEYAYVTQELRTSVRVWTAAIAEHRAIECIAAPDGDTTIANGALAEWDIAPLFLGLDRGSSHWYRTASRAKLRILFADEHRGWFASVERRGSLEVVDEPAWNAKPMHGRTFRVLQLDVELPTPDRVGNEGRNGDHAVHPVGAVDALLGLESQLVKTAHAVDRYGVLRRPVPHSVIGTRAARRELELFGALSRERSDRSPAAPCIQPTGMGRLPRARTVWPVYQLPLALRIDRMPVARLWIREGETVSMQFIRAVAKLIKAVHGEGFVLGSCHERMFAVGARWVDLDRMPEPVPVLVAAPVCVKRGERFSRLAGANAAYQDRYEMLGIPALLPDVAEGLSANPHVDAEAFGMFALDLLATTQAAPAEPGQSVSAALLRAQLGGMEFRNHTLAQQILKDFREPENRLDLAAILSSLAAD